MNKHELHLKIGEHLKSIDIENTKIIIDPACGGNQNIPLFLSDTKSNQTEICNVDLMIIKNNKIKIIIEIEEANVKPTQILGKFMTSALAESHIHKKNKDNPISMDENVCFIQILDTKKLNKKSNKTKQWDNIEDKIKKLLPSLQTNIKTYQLFYGNLEDINLNKISEFIKSQL